MIQGTSSHVGKSVVCTALCRIFKQDGYRVTPFKSQNMALNSYVTPEGGEIGRAQGVQAEAAGVPASVLMNPILLKPKADQVAQVVVLGRPVADMSAQNYRHEYLPQAITIVKHALEELSRQYQVVVIEGAGSPAEVNLKDQDIANMKVAELADAPVLLVADIDRGGVFASLVGTMELLTSTERDRVAGFIINKFRGDLSLLKPGLDWLEQRTGKPVLGVIPYTRVEIEEEDSVALEELAAGRQRGRVDQPGREEGNIDIAVIMLPRISNFTDFDPLFREPQTRVRYVQRRDELGEPDVIILPGTKNTALDLLYLRESGLAEAIVTRAETGGMVVGICGGYQMLGKWLHDPELVESDHAKLPGLGLLDVETVFAREKVTHQVKARVVSGLSGWSALAGQRLTGYEIHMGKTTLGPMAQNLCLIEERSGKTVHETDGSVGLDGRVMGTYIHGLFDQPEFRRRWLNTLRMRKGWTPVEGEVDLDYRQLKEDRYDRLAAFFREHLDLKRIYDLLGL
ncbi:MAG: cobyric acid synthase [Firmicutes bacterium]|nr:cobyric acid synthase [Bacillota bacterium]